MLDKQSLDRAAPYLVGVLAIATVAIAAWKFTPLSDLLSGLSSSHTASSGPSNIVLVDVARIVNAQTRLAVQTLNGNPDGLIRATRSGKLLEETIRTIAGPGVVVLIAQTVVVPEPWMRDITEEVLDTLGLPKDVPTADVLSRAESFSGPVDNYNGTGTEEAIRQLTERKQNADGNYIRQSDKGSTEALVP